MSAYQGGQNFLPEVPPKRWRELFMEADADRARLRFELEEARRDAARYRWLRERHEAMTAMHCAQRLGLDLSRIYVNTAEKFDAVLDAAIAAQGAKT